MMFLTHAARGLGCCRPVRRGPLRRRLVSAVAILTFATASVSAPRPAEALTLSELTLGIVAVGILSAVAIPSYQKYARLQAISSHVLSCPVFEGSGTVLSEGDCVWGKATGEWTAQAGTTDSTAMLRFGGQKEVAPGWFLGGTFGVGSRWLQNGNGTAGTGRVFDAGAALKRTVGPWLFAGAIAFSSTAMHLAPPGSGLEGDANVYGGGLRLRGAYDFAFAGWYLRPRLDLDLAHTWRPGFQLSGPGPAVFGLAGLSVEGFSKTSFVATPMVELGSRFDLDDRTVVRPYVAVGASFLPDNNATTSVSAIGPLGALGSIQSSSRGPSVLANVEAGLQIYKRHGLELKAEYALSVGNDYLSQGAGLRGAYHF